MGNACQGSPCSSHHPNTRSSVVATRAWQANTTPNIQAANRNATPTKRLNRLHITKPHQLIHQHIAPRAPPSLKMVSGSCSCAASAAQAASASRRTSPRPVAVRGSQLAAGHFVLLLRVCRWQQDKSSEKKVEEDAWGGRSECSNAA